MAQSLLEEASELFQEGRYQEASVNFDVLVSSGTEYSESPLVLRNLGRCYAEL